MNKSWWQHPTRHQLYGHLPPITKTIQVRRTRHAGHCWRSRDELLVMYSNGPPHMAKQKQDDQLEYTYSNYVRIRVVVLKTCQRRWTIGRSGERESGISVLAARHDDEYLNIVFSFYRTCHHHNLAVLLERISLTPSCYSSIASGRSSRLHPVSGQSCCR